MAKEKQANQNPEDMDEEVYELPYTITLQDPIEWGNETRETLVINRRLKAKDFKGIRATDLRFDDMIRLVSKATGESIKFIEELDGKDFNEASKVVQSFL